MQKNYRCPGCGNSMEFFPSTQKMYCAYCGASYSVDEVSGRQDREDETQNMSADSTGEAWGMWNPGGLGSGALEQQDVQYQSEKEQQRRHATIKMQILHCNSCGAELAMNGVEASSFCAYCGQATVVMDRVDEYLQPDYIIPFQITKEEAERIIRSRIMQGDFIPEGIKNFEVEKLRGIYVPFWLFDIYYGDDQYWKYTVKRGKSTVTRYSHRLGDCCFRRMTLDASKNLNDNSSQRLEPYDMNGLRDFDAVYLSGFYSDRFDMGSDDVTALAYERAKELFDDSVQKTIAHGGRKLVYTSPVREVKKKEYALLPVWFLTFRYENMPYTILVNGQTGKMVGAVPYVKKKAGLLFAILAVVFCLAFAILGAFLTPAILSDIDGNGRTVAGYFCLLGLAAFVTWSTAIQKYRAMITSIGLTRSGLTSRFVRERQDR